MYSEYMQYVRECNDMEYDERDILDFEDWKESQGYRDEYDY